MTAPPVQVAALLADVLADAKWVTFERPACNDHEREARARRACLLYMRAAPHRAVDGKASGRVSLAESSPDEHAIGAVVEIADGFAMSSASDSLQQQDDVTWPQVARITRALRDAGVDRWAAARGYPIELPSVGEPERDLATAAEPLTAAQERRGEDLTEYFFRRARAVSRLRADPPAGHLSGQALLQYRGTTAAMIGEARTWAHWAIPTGVPAWAHLAVGALEASRPLFMFGWQPESAPAGLVSLHQYVDNAETSKWLREHGVEIPEELRDLADGSGRPNC